MESNLVEEFVTKTGATAIDAHNQLKAKGWDLNLAITDYLNSAKSSLARPVLTKNAAVDDVKILRRGISRATDNVDVVSLAREELRLKIFPEDEYPIESPVLSFTLPDFFVHSDGFREFLERDLIELSCMTSLEQAGRLNWWADSSLCLRLWPLSTTGDGNCLLHAASLGMWGFHDRLLTLRQALHDFLTKSPCRASLYRRWRWQQTFLNAEAGLVLTEEEWERDWESIITMASSTPRNCGGRRRSMIIDKSGVPENATYESLEEIHVLALAHVLRRTILVIADTMLKGVNGENIQSILFGGIYIPLEVAPEKCHKNPLVLSYDAAHFSALVPMDNETQTDRTAPALIPLTDSSYKLLPVQFVVDPGKEFTWGRDELVPGVRERLRPSEKCLHSLLQKHLHVVIIPLSNSPSSEEFDDMDTPGDEEDIEKRFYEPELLIDYEDQVDSPNMFPNNKSRAARQLQTVARSFGSIGKSMSKKFKKNLGTITKMTKGAEKRDRGAGSTEAGRIPDYMVCARLSADTKPEYQQQMVHNYLNTARTRYEKDLAKKGLSGATNLELEKLQVQAKMEGPKNCITPGCLMYASVLTSYLCSACYEKQRQQELNNRINSPLLPRHAPPSQSYDLGKSTFYVEPTAKENGVLMRKPEDSLTQHISTATFYPKDWSSSSASVKRNTMANFSPKDLGTKRNTLQEVGNAIDGLGAGRYTPTNRNTVVGVSQTDGWNDGSGAGRKIHSYNLSRDNTPPNKPDTTVYTVKGTGIRPTDVLRMSPQNSTSVMSPQTSQDLTEIENVQPRSNSTEGRFTRVINIGPSEPVTRIIPVTVEGRITKTGDGLGRVNATHSGETNMGRVGDVNMGRFHSSYPGDMGRLIGTQKGDPYVGRATHFGEMGRGNTTQPIGDMGRINSRVSIPIGNMKPANTTCLNVTCTYFGSPELDNYCSKCYKGRQEGFIRPMH